MAEKIVHVHAKAKSFVDALGKMPRGAHALAPSGHFARDYNNLRKLALESEPELVERLLGKYVTVRQTASGGEVSEASFVEIETYARQIMEQLALLPPAGGASEAVGDRCHRSRADEPPKQAGKTWSRTEDEELIAEFDSGRAIKDLARLHFRTKGAIQSRLLRLGKITLGDGGHEEAGPDLGETRSADHPHR